MPASSDDGSAVGVSPEVGADDSWGALGKWFYQPWPLYADCWTATRYSRVGPAKRRVYDRLRERFPNSVGFPCGFKSDQFASLDDGEVADVQRFKNMLSRADTIGDPGEIPSFTSDAVATCPPYLRTLDTHAPHFDVRLEKDIR